MNREGGCTFPTRDKTSLGHLCSERVFFLHRLLQDVICVSDEDSLVMKRLEKNKSVLHSSTLWILWRNVELRMRVCV